MHGVEFSVLLHRALEARVEVYQKAVASEGGLRDPEVTHRIRVACRRLRSVMDLLDEGAYPKLRSRAKALRRFNKDLGELRDLDVQAAGLQELHAVATERGHQAALEHILESLARQRRKALAKLDPKAPGFEKLLKVPSLMKPYEGLPVALGAWASLEPRIAEALASLSDRRELEDVVALHSFRVGVKGLRDTLEALSSAFPAEPTGFLAELKAMQKALGDHHDRAALESLLWEHHRRLTESGRPALALALLDLLGAAAEARLQAFATFRALSGPWDATEFAARIQAQLGVSAA